MDNLISSVPKGTKETFWVLISSSTVFIFLRFYYKQRRGRGLHRDDLVLFAAWLPLVANGIIITVILDLLNSAQTTPPSVDTLNSMVLLGMFSTTLSLMSQAWSKSSFAITLLYVSDGWMAYFLWFAIISINSLVGTAALLFWIGCTPLEKSWRPLVEGTCWDVRINIVFNIIVSAYSGVMDLLFAAMSWKIILPLNLEIKEKMGCVIAMSMGIFAGAAAFIKCSKFPSIDPENMGDTMQLAIWSVVEPAVTIIAASIPALRLLVRSFAAKKQPAAKDAEEKFASDPSHTFHSRRLRRGTQT
ncbi:hypothetical protein SAPIO_CDS2026 [Scedosporium apiospermum]|uniref:Rhodopsin domain-containing protein n=1 Tax=Pseudallescheria apiosperma TaxID=563466 RepID=A0A084GE96_PSEDA|nr:uncharacterized protein SAPIO_CDS2026 [Scedosporium apiospermum]KEZ45658.1 hypothetical protein SAPIO_CDS2026 [Scedosporium apiospermum]